jgi:type III pantothenate kinase
MLLAINIENSHIAVGVFDASDVLCAKVRLATDLRKTSDEYATFINAILRERGVQAASLTEAIVSSVVPQMTQTLCEAVQTMIGITPLIVGPGIKTGFPIKIDTPSELGGDIVADVAAVVEHLKQTGRTGAAIVANVGTVTTVSAINGHGEYVGCAIFPGIRSSFELLHGKTAQLPNVALAESGRAIGKNSQDAVRSGVIRGHAMMLNGFVEQFAKEIKHAASDIPLFVTGEDAIYVTDMLDSTFVFDEHLTLKGLLVLHHNTTRTVTP